MITKTCRMQICLCQVLHFSWIIKCMSVVFDMRQKKMWMYIGTTNRRLLWVTVSNIMLEENKSNSRKWWIILKDIINKKKTTKTPSRFVVNGRDVTDKAQTAHSFNSYFVNIGKDLAKKIPKSDIDPLVYIDGHNQNTMVVEPVEHSEVRKIIMSIKKWTAGWDGIHLNILKPMFFIYRFLHMF